MKLKLKVDDRLEFWAAGLLYMALLFINRTLLWMAASLAHPKLLA